MKTLLCTTYQKNKLWLFVLLLCLTFSCKEDSDVLRQSEQDKFIVPLEEAVIVAEAINFESTAVNSSNQTERISEKGDGTKKIKTIKAVKDRNNTDAIFIVNYENGGFSIISADKRIQPILAYSGTNLFDTYIVPSGVNEWLANTISNIEDIRKTVNVPNPDAKKEWDELAGMVLPPPGDDPDPCSNTQVKVEPLLQTTWGQGCEYNLYLPLILGCSGQPCDRAYTGCVATAMAQIMKYHNYPSNYNWHLMPNSSPYTTVESQEISRLMRDIGQMVDMDYKCGSSGANTKNEVAQSFVDDFGYSSADYVDYEGTSNHNLVEYELKNNRPVLFKGGEKGSWFVFPVYEGGHAWVCDGYVSTYYCESGNTSLYLSMNWGWNGTYNGWYAYNNFNPGGNTYNYQSGVIVNIRP